MMKAHRGNGLIGRRLKDVQVDNDLKHGREDARAAWRADHQRELAVPHEE